MSAALPIACALGASDMSQRLAEMAALGAAALLDVRHVGRHAELRFAARTGVRERVEAVVAAESECCAFLTMRVTGAGRDRAHHRRSRRRRTRPAGAGRRVRRRATGGLMSAAT